MHYFALSTLKIIHKYQSFLLVFIAVDLLCFLPLVKHLQEAERETVPLRTSSLLAEREAINREFSDIFGTNGVTLLLIYFYLFSR